MDALYEMAGDAVYAANPSALMLFEGTGQLGTVAMNWGDGFATDPAVVTAGGVQSAQPFFNMVLSKPWAANVVISPHLYPPSVSTHRELDQVTGSGLFARLSNSFGYLTKKGVCSTVTPSKCRTYPIVFGETGSKFTDELDLKMLQDFATYMRSEDALHVPILNMFWWSFNANSGDTGTCAREREGGRERERERERGEKKKWFLSFRFFLRSSSTKKTHTRLFFFQIIKTSPQAGSSATTGARYGGTKSIGSSARARSCRGGGSRPGAPPLRRRRRPRLRRRRPRRRRLPRRQSPLLLLLQPRPHQQRPSPRRLPRRRRRRRRR